MLSVRWTDPEKCLDPDIGVSFPYALYTTPEQKDPAEAGSKRVIFCPLTVFPEPLLDSARVGEHVRRNDRTASGLSARTAKVRNRFRLFDLGRA